MIEGRPGQEQSWKPHTTGRQDADRTGEIVNGTERVTQPMTEMELASRQDLEAEVPAPDEVTITLKGESPVYQRALPHQES
jgi:hypothetical protein